MPWCPKCGCEYEDGIEECVDCSLTLVDTKPEIPDPDEGYVDDEPAFLVTVRDSIEAGMVESQLKVYGIPVLRSFKESGGYMSVLMGDTVMGIDIYVPSKLLEQATEIISSDLGVSDAEIENDAMDEQAELQSEEPKIENHLIFTPVVYWIIAMVILVLLIWRR